MINVLLPIPLHRIFRYALEDEVPCVPGQFVVTNFRNRDVVGIVWPDDIGVFADRDAHIAKPKFAQPIDDIPAITHDFMEFLYWVSRYYAVPIGKIAKLALNIGDPRVKHKTTKSFHLADDWQAICQELRITPKRQRVIDFLQNVPSIEVAGLADETGASSAVINAMFKAGILSFHEVVKQREIPAFRATNSKIQPNDEQRAAMDVLRADVHDGFHVTLLQGVTGSGKSEVYLDSINECLSSGKQALIMLPEIAMSTQWLERFEQRFGVPALVWHSDIASQQRKLIWQAVLHDKPLVVVGARSAIFLPFRNLGLIVVDEEHDTSFKQSEGVRYNARDLAILRAHRLDISCILVSATPSMESYHKAQSGAYGWQQLSSRIGNAQMPKITTINLCEHKMLSHQWITPALHEAMTDTLDAKQQCLLFLNRRGYAPLLLCGTCGYRFNCADCSSWMTLHGRLEDDQKLRLQCHQCGDRKILPHTCPQCETNDSLRACGPGVERLFEEVQTYFPNATCAIAASDTLTSMSRIQDFFDQVQAGTIDIIVGTQMIAKGHHFPNLTLVGIIDADMALQGGELHAAERSFQTLQQVAGRAGRESHPGRVFIQTSNPESEFIKLLQGNDFSKFALSELQKRQMANWPPYGYLVAIIVSGPALNVLSDFCAALARVTPRNDNMQFWGPAVAPLALLRGLHRKRFLIQCKTRKNIQSIILGWIDCVRHPNNIKIEIDIDPYNFH